MGRCGAEGACGRKGRFFKEKAPQKPFLKKVFGVPHGVGANMAVPTPEGARPVFAEGKDRLRWAFLPVAHFSLGGGMFECLERISNWDLSNCYDMGPLQK